MEPGAEGGNRTHSLLFTKEAFILMNFYDNARISRRVASHSVIIGMTLEPNAGIEPALPVYKTGVLPLN